MVVDEDQGEGVSSDSDASSTFPGASRYLFSIFAVILALATDASLVYCRHPGLSQAAPLRLVTTACPLDSLAKSPFSKYKSWT